MKRFVVTGGGTGGHIYPAIAICKELSKLEPDLKILYIGGKIQREASIIPNFGLDFAPIDVEYFPRRLSKRIFKFMYKVPMGFFQSLSIMKKFSPHVVIGTGGYVCGPVLLGAAILRIPILIQEQNALPGITNRIMGRWAAEIHVPFEEAVRYFSPEKVKITPNPIREGLTDVTGGREKFGLSHDKFTISFIGGSQGASSINKAAVEAFKRLIHLASSIQIIHQTGNHDFQSIKEEYDKLPFTAVVQPYFDNIEYLYSATDLVVCRSGAMTLAEIAACGIPAILVPYPYSAEGHQIFNAQAIEKSGAGIMIRDEE